MQHKVVINTHPDGFGLNLSYHSLILTYLESKGLSEDQISDYWGDKTPRHDSLLVEAVETLGEEANGDYCTLEVIPIEGNVYRICCNRGAEYVEEPSDVKWITIK